MACGSPTRDPFRPAHHRRYRGSKGAITSNEPNDLLHLLLRHRAEPGSRRLPVTLHRREKEPDVPGRHIGQGVGPVFEDALVDALRLMQMRATIIGNARPQDMMMAPLDDVDGVDLQIAQMLYGAKGRVPPSPNDARSSRRWA